MVSLYHWTGNDMKKLLTICILLSIITMGYASNHKDSPGVMLGLTYRDVQSTLFNHHNYYLTEVSDTSLVYHDWKQDITITYIFKRYKGTQYCTTCIYTVDCLAGEELIGSHQSDWTKVDDMTWLYDTPNYDIPLTVTLKYIDGFMAFSYRYIPKEIE